MHHKRFIARQTDIYSPCTPGITCIYDSEHTRFEEQDGSPTFDDDGGVARSTEPKQDAEQVLPPPLHDEPSASAVFVREPLEVATVHRAERSKFER